MSEQMFYSSLIDSENSFMDAIEREEQSGFAFEDTLDRKYEEGFIDGMRHAYALLMNSTPAGQTADEIEKGQRAVLELRKQGAPAERCDHDNYSKTWNNCKTHEEMDAECIEVFCDNCNKALEHHK